MRCIRLTAIDPWFLQQMRELLDARGWYADLAEPSRRDIRTMKRMGFRDRSSRRLRRDREQAAERRWRLGVRPAYKIVDTCAGEFPSSTPYLYSSYDDESEVRRPAASA
jgi:carbamoyl-phosphate synthase large subunit